MASNFPPPPGFKKPPTKDPFPGPPVGYVAPVETVTDEETYYLMKQYLLPHHMSDHRVIKFITQYITSRSTPDAAEIAGFGRQRGSYWRGKPDIHACIEAITAKAVMKHGYDAGEMIERAKEIATIDPIEFQNPDGTFKTHLSEIRPEARRAIKKFKAKNLFDKDANGMSVVVGVLMEIELWDKMKGIELLGSEKNIFKKTTVVQHDVTSNMSSFLLESGKRADERKQLMERVVSDASDEGSSGSSERGGDSVSESDGSSEGDGDSAVVDIESVSREES